MSTVKAGQELQFGALGKSVRLQTSSNSIRCEVYGDNNEHKKYLATKSGFLLAESLGNNLTRNGKSESK